MPSATQWRFRFWSVNAGPSVAITELQLRATSGGSDLTTGASISASSTFSTNVASRAIDDNTGTQWVSNTFSAGTTLTVTLGSASEVNEVVITGFSDATYSPNIFDLQYYDGSQWITLAVFTAGTWTASQTRTFTIPTLGATKRYWQLSIFANQGAPNTALEEIAMDSGGSGLLLSATASASTTAGGLSPSNANDGVTASSGAHWSSSVVNPPHWWRADLGAGNAISAPLYVRITSLNDAALYLARTPTDFSWGGSNDQITWRNHYYYSGAGAWGAAAQTQTFNLLRDATSYSRRRFGHFLEHSP